MFNHVVLGETAMHVFQSTQMLNNDGSDFESLFSDTSLGYNYGHPYIRKFFENLVVSKANQWSEM